MNKGGVVTNIVSVAKSMGVLVHVVVDARKAMIAMTSAMNAFNDLMVAARQHKMIQSHRNVIALSWNYGGRWRKWLRCDY